MSEPYRLVQVRGDHRALGRQHGEQCREQIIGFVDYLGGSLKLSSRQLSARAARFVPLFEAHCPHLVDEVRGLAEGAGIAFEQALVPQMRGELGQVQDSACTTFVIAAHGTAARGVLIGQNCDMEVEYEEFGYVLHLEPDDKPPLVVWTFGGQIGYHGMNRAGVAHFANALGGGPAWKWGLPHYPVKRMMLEQSSLSDVLDLLRRAPVCSNGNYVLCDGTGQIANVEVTSQGFEQMAEQATGFLVHTNHYLCGAHACRQNFDQCLPDSFPRLQRVRELIAGKFGTLAVSDLRTILADHSGFPTSICRHSHQGPDHPSVSARGRTVTSIIAEPAKNIIHVAKGNPCTSEYATYSI